MIFVLGSFASAKGQGLTNTSFENWAVDTNDLSLVIPSFGVNVQDTAISSEADGWTSTNAITSGATFHNVTLCTQEYSNVYYQSSALKLISDSIKGVIGPLAINIVAPGFIVSGRFPINLGSFANLAGNFNPLALPGAGVPISGRKGKIGGYLKYLPQGGDTAYVVALLRKGSTVVAQASYKHYGTDASYTYFEVPFIYQSCLEPDTLVYSISSGNPYTYNNLISQLPTGLHMGSTLYADSVFVGDTLNSFVLPPFLTADTAHTTMNVPVSIPVTLNDNSCYGTTFNLTVSIQPLHGTATVGTADSIVYTPANGFTGYDTLYYTATVGSSATSSPARVRVRVTAPTGVTDISEGQTRIYPNPANSKLHISTTNPSITGVNIYDVLGGLIRTEAINANLTVDLSTFNEGIYFVRFTGSEGRVLSSSRFSVVK